VPLEEVFQTLRRYSNELSPEKRLPIFGHNKLEEK